MDNGKLFLSFWNLCLENLPVGAFTHRLITPDEARSRIERARQENRLLCVSHDDLLPPFRKRERENYEALCRVLAAHYGIALSEGDFLSKDESGGDPLYSAIPLNCVQVRNHDKLMVVTCYYVLGEKKAGELLPFGIEPNGGNPHDRVRVNRPPTAFFKPNRSTPVWIVMSSLGREGCAW